MLNKQKMILVTFLDKNNFINSKNELKENLLGKFTIQVQKF